MFNPLLAKRQKTLFAGVKFTWSGQIMKLAVTGNQSNQRISYEMRSQWNQSIISKGW